MLQTDKHKTNGSLHLHFQNRFIKLQLVPMRAPEALKCWFSEIESFYSSHAYTSKM